MNIIGKVLSLIWRGWFVSVVIINTFIWGVFIIIPLCFREKDFPKAYYFMRIWAKIVFYGSGLSLKKVGFESFESSHPYVIISNHTSMMDIMVMLMINKDPMVFVGKKELKDLPIFGFIFRRLHILVDRKDPQSRKNVYNQSIKKIKENKSICIFPEGGVPDETVFLDRFKDGPFAIAIINQVPLITVTICGLKQILPYAYFQGRPGKVTVKLNSIESTENLSKTDIAVLKNKSREEILNALKHCEAKNQHY
ncbi:1-acyl-sn-glycerol-3-phosphate acyltransferase [Flavobacteriaceae bacterium Ap0902]|nr:1-acyl-sn-glycerol-3-phosphate acyltransferase [Flavobacteriaceae bacterium Ap0902]